MPLSDSFAVSTDARWRVSAFFFKSSLVRSVTCRCACAASVECAIPRARTIWLFQRGMVFTMVVWIFSIMVVSLFWIIRICGAVCMEMVLVSSRSWSFFSKRSHLFSRSLAACASSGSPLAAAFWWSSLSFPSRTSWSFFLPARMYMESSLKYARFCSYILSSTAESFIRRIWCCSRASVIFATFPSAFV